MYMYIYTVHPVQVSDSVSRIGSKGFIGLAQELEPELIQNPKPSHGSTLLQKLRYRDIYPQILLRSQIKSP